RRRPETTNWSPSTKTPAKSCSVPQPTPIPTVAYDPIRGTVWTTNESAGTETVIDAEGGAVRATVPLGGDVGNVVYNPFTDRMVVAVTGRHNLAALYPRRS